MSLFSVDEESAAMTLRFRFRLRASWPKRCHFKFKLKYSKILPISRIYRLWIRLDLRPFSLELESKPESALSWKRKLKNYIQRFNCNRSGNNGIVKSWLPPKNHWFRRRRKKCDLLWVVSLAVVSCFVIMQLMRSYIRSRFLWHFFWMIWNYASHQFFKEILDGVSRSLGF